MKFWKMNGAGNDFIVINNLEEKLPEKLYPNIAKLLCERHLSIGADGMMVVCEPSAASGADIRMLFINSDGSLGEMCGNGARCICRYTYENGLAKDKDRQVIETTAGIVTGERISERMFRIRLNDPSVIELHKELTLKQEDLPFDISAFTLSSFAPSTPGVYMERAGAKRAEKSRVQGEVIVPCSYLELGCPGLPHLVVEYSGIVADLCRPASGSRHLADADEAKLRELGRALRWHKDLPKGANVNFYELTGSNEAYERTFERGVEDFTYACGTGTGCVAAVLSLLKKASGFGIEVTMRGGKLVVDVGAFSEETFKVTGGEVSVLDPPAAKDLFLTGPTNIVARGEVMDEDLELS